MRREIQRRIFDWRDKNGDGYWPREECIADMTIGRGRPCLAAVRPGGAGDITDSHVRWTIRRSSTPSISNMNRVRFLLAGARVGAGQEDRYVARRFSGASRV